MKRIAINGLGRVGRSILRQYADSSNNAFEIVAINDLMPAENLVYLMKYDSAHGRFQYPVFFKKNIMNISDKKIPIFNEKEPKNLPWRELNIDMVIESSGLFRTRALVSQHLDAGARRVLISAPSEDTDLTLVMGVNETTYDPERHYILSNASCTTNSLAPVLKALMERFGIINALVTTIHAYTGGQAMVDRASKKIIRGRAGASNIIPTDTGADIATMNVIPELKGRLSALAVRVPVLNGSLTDISVNLEKATTAEEVNHYFKAVAENSLKGILDYTDEPLVSSDIIGNPHSGIIHGLSTRVVRDSALKLQVWYDNEFAYARRCLDLIEHFQV